MTQNQVVEENSVVDRTKEKQNKLSYDRLVDILDYNKETGEFFWKVRKGHVMAGSPAGFIHSKGYRIIKINHVQFYAHRLAWLYVHGEWPKDQIDHINHIRSDNRMENLREATNQENHKNQSMRSDNKSGMTGVHWHNGRGKWAASVVSNKKRVNLGYFDKLEDAMLERKMANIKYGYREGHGEINAQR